MRPMTVRRHRPRDAAAVRSFAPLAACAALAPRALAGMPSLTLTDLAGARLEVISFFLLAFLLSAAAVMGLWNYLRRDFPRLPRLTYRRSLVLTGLWGLLFILVLTMISGARELMTPGAWEKNGLTYRLSTEFGKGAAAPTDADRRVAADVVAARPTRAQALAALLRAYAANHAGAFPEDDHAAAPAEIPPAAWETPDPSRARYVYVPGRRAETDASGDTPVAYEPPIFGRGAPVWVMMTGGTARLMTPAELDAALRRHLPPSTRPSTSPTSS
jgi:hypothetical protein